MNYGFKPPPRLKTRLCKCGREFLQYTTMQTKCVDCAIKAAKNNTEAMQMAARRSENAAKRLDRAKTRARLSELKTRSEWLKAAQKEVNKWIRLVRDRDLPCVSCGTKQAVQWHASHYRSVGACPALRFNPLNIHKSCSQCNDWKGGNVIEYRIELAKRITPEQLAYLEGPHEPLKLSIPQIKAVIEHYRILTKQLA